MLRCDYNVVSFRVLCATLLATAVTLTVILTNVVIDIDGFLSVNKPNSGLSETSKITSEYEIIEGTETDSNNEDKSYYNEFYPFYRTRRSIESGNLQVHVKDPGLKKILTNRLASLLKELDKEEAMNEENKPETTTVISANNLEKMLARDNSRDGINNDDLLHLAMHNILLQGMIGHMDLNDVYKKVHELVKNFNNASDKIADKNSKILDAIVNSNEDPETRKSNPYNDEHKFFEELIKCKKLQSEIARDEPLSIQNIPRIENIKKDNKIYIKAVIEINEDNVKNNKINVTNTTENVEGVIRLIYNGRSIKVNQVKDMVTPKIIKNKLNSQVELITVNHPRKDIEELEIKTETNNNKEQNQNMLLKKLIEEYMKTHSNNDYLESNTKNKNIKTKRLKRQIKIRYIDDKISDNPKNIHEHTKFDDDDVYIEIETHFDGKGIKGEKKKKLVRNLIDKIEKALHSDIHKTNNIIEHIKFVKRTQDPIDDNKYTLLNKITPPHDRIEHRQLDPIDKTLKTHETLLNKVEDSWKDQIENPRFLSASKSVNSAEMREINIEYDTVLKNGIPKRLQKPINADNTENNATAKYNNDLDNVTLLLKDIDGTGFSIGINQYVGEPPDKDSINMFNGIENLIKEYHQSYDQEISNESDIDKGNIIELINEANEREDKNTHKIQRRSTDEVNNVHNNKIFFRINDVPFEKYLEKFKHSYTSLFRSKELFKRKNTDDPSNKNISEKLNTPNFKNNNHKPPETLTLVNSTNRIKRSLIVKKISNVKTKIKLSRFINTNAMANKKIFLKNKRNKRQINKIRIITKDRKDYPKNSDENIFMLSRENGYSDKATLIKELETPETVIDVKNQNQYDEIYPVGDMYRNNNPEPMYSDLYDTKTSSSRLMSRYPHIFFNENSESKEEKLLTNDYVYGVNDKPYRIQPKQNTLKQTATDTNVTPVKGIPNVEEIIKAIVPPASVANYKLTVKITPKNLSNTNTGFKEVHTSVNKSFDDNGLRYFSLFNLSQISKIEKLNKTTDLIPGKRATIDPKPLNNQLKEQQKQIKTLLELHKKRVDHQLSNLLQESKHLEKMIEANSKNNINKAINILHDDIIEEVPNNDKMNKILASIKNLQEGYNSIKNSVIIEPKIVTEKPKFIANKPEINTLKFNEKVTNEILNKIDSNTNILKAFLQRFSDSLKPNMDVHISTTQNPDEIKINLAKEWKSYNKSAFYGLNESKNDTIPFIYAYQQNKGPLASMLYHGHIHTNTIQNDYAKDKPSSKNQPNVIENSNINRRKFNETKFFIDDMENYFKVAPSEPFVADNIKTNVTNV